MSKYAHVVKAAGLLINDDYIARLVKNHRQFIGAAAIQDGKIAVARFMTAPTLDAIKTLQDTFKDTTALICVGDVKGMTEDSMQPFEVLKDEEGNTICVVAMDGNFERHLQGGVAHSAEKQVFDKFISKKISKWFKNGGAEGVIEQLNDQDNKDELALLWQDRGSVTFMFGSGEVITLSAGNAQEGKFSWGYTSNNYGYLENVGAKKPEEVSKPVTLADKMLGAFGMKSTATSAPAAAPTGGTVVHQATLPPKTETTAAPTGGILVKPDTKVYDTRKKLSAYYEARLGHAPNGYKSAPALLETTSADGQKSYTLADTKSLSTLKHTMRIDGATIAPAEAPEPEQTQTTEVQNDKPVETKPVASGKSPMPGSGKSPMPGATSVPQTSTKDTAPKNIDGQDHRQNKAVVTSAVPVFSPEQKEKIKTVLFKKPEFAGILSTDTYQPILDPKALKTMDSQFQNFMEGFGKKMELVENWPFEAHLALAQFALDQKDPKISAKLSFDLVRQLIVLRNQNKHLLSKVRELNPKAAAAM